MTARGFYSTNLYQRTEKRRGGTANRKREQDWSQQKEIEMQMSEVCRFRQKPATTTDDGGIDGQTALMERIQSSR